MYRYDSFEGFVQYANQEFHGTSYHGHAFNGGSLLATLESIKASDAASCITYEGYSVCSIALHLAYCKYRVAEEIAGDGNLGTYPFPIGIGGFCDLEKLDAAKWKTVVEYLERIHRTTMTRIKGVKTAELGNTMADWEMTLEQAIIWTCNHDTYHLAQIRNMGVPGMARKKVGSANQS